MINIKQLSFPVSLLKSNIVRSFSSYTPKSAMHFSNGNSKTHTPSIDLPAGVFCNKNAACWKEGRCYACHLRECAQVNYIDNMTVVLNNMQDYFNKIRSFLKTTKSKFFRYHVSGEIINNSYLDNMVAIAKEFKSIVFWTYTKKYNLINNYLDQNKKLPKNLIIMFSADENLKMTNPYNMPIFTQYYKGNEKECLKQAKEKGLKASFCCGNCKKCQDEKIGCPYTGKNSVIFCHIHGSKYNTYNTAVDKKGLESIKNTSKIYKEYTNNNKFCNGVLKF